MQCRVKFFWLELFMQIFLPVFAVGNVVQLTSSNLDHVLCKYSSFL